MRWLDDILRTEKEFGFKEIKFGNQFFSKSKKDEHGIYFHTEIYIPSEGRIDRMWCVASNARLYIQADGEAQMLKKSVVDESLPYRIELLKKDVFGGGREINAMLLGMIKYHEACPELLEAATHDPNYQMRAICAESLGDMGKGASKYTPGICNTLQEDRDAFVRTLAAEACEKIGDKRAIKPIRETIEEIKPNIRYLKAQGYPFQGTDNEKKKEMEWSLLLFEHSIKALFKLDQKSGIEELAKGLNDISGGIYHHAKRALFFTDIGTSIALERGTIPIYTLSGDEKQRNFLMATGLKG